MMNLSLGDVMFVSIKNYICKNFVCRMCQMVGLCF